MRHIGTPRWTSGQDTLFIWAVKMSVARCETDSFGRVSAMRLFRVVACSCLGGMGDGVEMILEIHLQLIGHLLVTDIHQESV